MPVRTQADWTKRDALPTNTRGVAEKAGAGPSRHDQLTQLYTTGVISVVAATTGLLGDFNGDGKVDAADYVRWRKNHWQQRTPNDNGLTTQTAGFNLWCSNFGNMSSSGADASVNATVPEPATLVLLMFAPAGWCLRRGRAA